MGISESNKGIVKINGCNIRELVKFVFSEKECTLYVLYDNENEQLENDRLKIEIYPRGDGKGERFATADAVVVSRAFLASVNKRLKKVFVLKMTGVAWHSIEII